MNDDNKILSDDGDATESHISLMNNSSHIYSTYAYRTSLHHHHHHPHVSLTKSSLAAQVFLERQTQEKFL